MELTRSVYLDLKVAKVVDTKFLVSYSFNH